nr:MULTISPECIES: hypothetical protein [Bifidobacterium]
MMRGPRRAAARMMARVGASIACMAAVLSLAACVPHGTAVGDTQGHTPSTAHIGTVRDDAVVGVVGSSTAAADKTVLDAFAAADIDAVYVSVKDAADAADAAHRAQQGVRDMISRVVSLVIVSDIDVTADADGWDSALRDARNAGIPVALLSPVHAPSDATLYAATLVINDRAADATPIDEAAMTILNDEPHAREITVSTVR